MIPRLNKYHNHPRKELHPVNLSTDGLEIPVFSHKVEHAPSMYIIYDSDLLQQFIDKSVSWCSNNLGYRTDIEETPDIEWSINNLEMQKLNVLGYHDADLNLIQIRIQGHRTWVNLAGTVIHEWVHYLQSERWYNRYRNKFKYEQNPYEKMAYYYAAVNCNKCANFAWKKISNEYYE